MASTRRNLWIAYTIGAFGLGINNQLNLLVPLRARELGAGFDIIGLILASASVVPALTAIPIGRVIDRIGPRSSFIIGTGLSSIICLSFIMVTNYWWFLILQPIFGVARMVGWVGSQGYITAIGTEEDRATNTGAFSFFGNVGTMAGPLIAGFAAQFVGYRMAFLAAAIYCLMFTIVGLFLADLVTDRRPIDVREPGGIRTALKILRIKGMQLVLLITFVRLWNERMWGGFFPVYLADLNIEPQIIGLVIFVRGTTAALVAPTTGLWVRMIRTETLAILGLSLSTVGMIISPYFAAVPLVYLPAMLIGVGAGFSLPVLLAIIGNVIPRHQTGVALSLRQTVNYLSGGVAALAGGALVTALGITFAFGVAGAFAFVLLAAGSLLSRHLPRV